MVDTHIKYILKSMPTLETDRLILRRLTKNDAKDIYEYASNPNVPKFLTWTEHESYEYTKRYLRYVISKYKSAEYLDWGIELKCTGKLIGTCGFTSVDIPNSKGEIGYVISEPYWNNGYATEAVKRVLEHAFFEIEFNRMEARVMEGNDSSAKVLKKCGMIHEGTFRQEIFVKGEFRSIMHFALCKDSF